MTQKLPVSNFHFLEVSDEYLNIFRDTNSFFYCDGECGYVLEVDLDYVIFI